MKAPTLARPRVKARKPVMDSERSREHRRMKRADFLQSMCFMGPSFLGVLVFFIVPFQIGRASCRERVYQWV